MASGLFALLDDIAAIAKTAAASLDDVAVQAAKATKKAAGIVIDDAAVTPRYVVGFAAERELPIIGRIAWGSIMNKVLYLLPGALLLSWLAPWVITPILMIGGAYLCWEGYEKVHQMVHPASAASGPAVPAEASLPGAASGLDEEAKIASAVRTDFVLSAEIMAISLASITATDFLTKAAVLSLVGLLVTVAVYGSVALIVKADDFGLYLAQHGRLSAARALGRSIVAGMPAFLKLLTIVGMLAMLWVGGGIILHGLEEYGLGALPQAIHAAAKAAGEVFGPASSFVTWLVDAAAAGFLGLLVGWPVAWVASKAGWSH